jgi:hypothetical protein
MYLKINRIWNLIDWNNIENILWIYYDVTYLHVSKTEKLEFILILLQYSTEERQYNMWHWAKESSSKDPPTT